MNLFMRALIKRHSLDNTILSPFLERNSFIRKGSLFDKAGEHSSEDLHFQHIIKHVPQLSVSTTPFFFFFFQCPAVKIKPFSPSLIVLLFQTIPTVVLLPSRCSGIFQM